MAEQAADRGTEPKGSLIGEIVGRNRRFDDRVDTRPDIATADALAVMGRSARLLAHAKGLFAAKFLLQLVMATVPALLLPFLAKIVVDNAIRQQPFGTTDVRYPPYMEPLIRFLDGQDPLTIMLTMTMLFVALLVVLGARAGGTGGWRARLLEGQDAATQAENRLSAGGSTGGGLVGLVEFMVNVRLTQTLANRLRTRLFQRLTRLPMRVLDDQRAGDSIYRVLYDAPMVPDLAFEVSLTPFFMLVGAAVNFYILEYSYGEVAPELVWVAWLTVPVAFAITFPFSGALRRTSQNKRAAGAATTNTMEESLSSVAAVQSLGAGGQERRRFAERSAQSFLRERYYIAVIIAAVLLFGAAGGLAAIYVTIVITDRIIDGTMSAGDFALLIGAYYGIVEPAGYFGAYWIKLQDAIAGVRRVLFFFDHESEEDRVGGVAIDGIRRVAFRDVGFAYPDGQQALAGVDLELQRGEMVAIVGPTGAGKTTLAYLIPSLLAPTSGRVAIDGRDVMDIDVDSLRRQVTYVFQEHLMLADSIRGNLLLANPDATEEQMAAALDMAGCTAFVADLPDGMDTVLGRAGEPLSVGQQQRLSIARGLVRQTPVLILDEPTAALDPQTENALVESLKAASRERLVVVIAHRLSTIRHADRIVFLEEGRIREVGGHDELMARPGSPYREFVELQTG